MIESFFILIAFIILWGVWNNSQKRKPDYLYRTIPVLLGPVVGWIFFIASIA